ncbi:uncharacterized protein LOC143053718 [Mytilus galloprovincialis]|uniref:uncharacterized protein LOC143053718 n=1 Tax=Mytilus galloprovincialis TaxID=29158 RepID=UPI003F7CA461
MNDQATGEGSNEKDNKGKGNIKHGKMYIQGQDLGDETRNKEFKLGAGSYESNVLKKDVSKYMCGFLNSSGGTLYIGVDDYGKVIGTQCDHATRDRIRIDIDTAIKTIKPNVFPQNYHVDFIPVYHKSNALKDCKVIEITVEAVNNISQVYETDGKVYVYRYGSIQDTLNSSKIKKCITTYPDIQMFTSRQTQTTLSSRSFEGCTNHFIPTEIKLLSDKKYVPVYLKLLESGSEKKREIRLVIVGKKGTGKTSLLKRLFGEEINNGQVTSTNGIEIHRIRCKANSDDGIWKKLDGKKEETELHARLLKPFRKSLISQVKDPVKVSVDEAAHKFSQDNSQATSFVEGQVVDESQVTPSVTTKSHDLHLSSEQAFRDIEIMLKSDVDLQDKEDYATLFLWDFAGDEEFYHTHQTFLSPNAIYLVVTKLNEADDKDAQDLFRLWMNSIHCYSRQEEDNNKSEDISRESDDLDPPVVIVGTWKDDVYSESGEFEDVLRRNILMYTENMTEDECGHIRKEFFISNTKDDNSVFQQMRQDILNLARSMRTWNKDYPLKFIQLEKLLQKKKKELPIITLQELKHISTGPTNPLKDEELMLYLKYHHEIKALVYFEDLPDYIILDTQWLSDAFKCIVTAKKFRNVSIKNQKRWKEFHCKGKLHREVIEEMFKKEQNILYKHKDHILKVMEKFDIIIRPTISNTDVPGEKQCYYVPCMIKAEPEYDIYQLFNVTENTCQKSTWLCFKFKFLPPYLMNHLIASLCREYQVAEIATSEQKRQIALFRGSAVFELQKTTKLRKLLVMKSLNTIQIQVWQFGKQIERGLYNYIANFVTEEIIKIIDTRFKMSNVKFEKKWECGLTKPEYVTGSNEFSEEQIENIYYCDICRTTHTFTDEWSDPQRQKLSLPRMPFEDVPETDPKTETTRKSQTISTKVHFNFQSCMDAFSSVSEGPNRTGSSTGFTKEEFNFAKMGMIVLNILANALYDLLKQDKTNLRARSDCDITYLYSEHRKLNKHIPSNSSHRRCPPGPWGGSWQDIQVTDIAIGDDIERIRLTRNELQHSGTFKLADKLFNDLCEIVTDLLKRFDQHIQPARLYTDHLNEILAKSISEEEVKVVHQKIENEIKSGTFIFIAQVI